MAVPTELWIPFALAAWVAVLLPIAAWADRWRERRRLRAIEGRGGRLAGEDDAVAWIANSRWEDSERG